MEFPVEAILDRRIKGRQLQYLVKWQDYPLQESTWEPAANLTGCSKLLKQFEQKRSGARFLTHLSKKNPEIAVDQSTSAVTSSSSDNRPQLAKTELPDPVDNNVPKNFLGILEHLNDNSFKVPQLLPEKIEKKSNTEIQDPPNRPAKPLVILPIKRRPKAVQSPAKPTGKGSKKPPLPPTLLEEDSSDYVEINSSNSRHGPLTDRQEEKLMYQDKTVLFPKVETIPTVYFSNVISEESIDASDTRHENSKNTKRKSSHSQDKLPSVIDLLRNAKKNKPETSTSNSIQFE